MTIKIEDNYPDSPALYIDEKLVNPEEYEIDELEVNESIGLSMNIIGIEKNRFLLNKSLENFPLISFIKVVEDSSVPFTLNKINWINKYSVTFDRKSNVFEGKNDLFESELEFRLDSKFFKENLSYAQYQLLLEKLNRFTENNQRIKIKNFYMSYEGGVLGATLVFNDVSVTEPLIDEINRMLSVLVNIIENSQSTQTKISTATIKTYYDFPAEIRVYCEQYLLYFTQFLQELGIKTTRNLNEEAGKVLFSVTPTDDIEALDKIREALAIYLSLSSNPTPHSTGDRTVDMVLSGARANAKHLESQLELAIAKLQFKEATLELKDATIEQNQLALRQRDDTIKDLKEMLARGNIFEESLEKVVINGEVVEETSLYRFSREDAIEVESAPVLDEKTEETRIGLVKFHEVTKLKDYGVSFDLAKGIRGLIDYFKRDKNSR